MPTHAALRRFFTAGVRDASADARPWRLAAVRHMFWVGLAVRLLYLTLAHTYRFRVSEDHFPFGWEMGRIARALATGHGFADPFGGHTGPTAWTPPLYPLLMAACFKLFGVYSNLSAWFLLAINSLCSAATAPAVYEIARRCYSRRLDPSAVPGTPNGASVALWSGWLWALYPAAMQYAVHWPWDMAVTAWFFSLALVFGLRLRGIGSAVPGIDSSSVWAVFGLLWGLIALSNSSLLTFLPFQVLWILWPFHRQLTRSLPRALPALMVFLACLAPWIVRNQRAFHAFVPMRANLGVELYMAALPSLDGFPAGTDIPITTSSPELQRYARMGELAYSKEQGRRARALIAADPARFLRYVLLRFQFFWTGVPHPYDHGAANETIRLVHFSFLSIAGLLGLALSLYRRVPAAGVFAAAFVVFPVIYYVVTAQARFRHPLEPLITIFCVFLFQSADRSRLFSFQPAPHRRPTVDPAPSLG